MKERKDMNLIKIFFRGVAIVTLIVGSAFSILVAHFDDAPGFVLFGGVATLAAAALIYGFGEIIVQLQKNGAALSEIEKELRRRNK